MASKNRQNSKQPDSKPHLAIAMLVMTAVVIGLAIMIANRKSGLGGDQSRNGAGSQSEVQKVCDNAKGLMKDGAFGPARDLAMAYLKANPNDTQVRPLLAECQIELGELGQAQNTLGRLIALELKQGNVHAQSHWLMAKALKREGDGRYVEFLKRAADSEDARPEMLGDYGREMLMRGDLAAAQSYLRAASAKGDHGSLTLAALGELAFRRRDFAGAAKQLQESIRVLEESAKLKPPKRQDDSDFRDRSLNRWELLTTAYRALGQNDLAAKAIDEGLRAQRSGQLYMDKGTLLLGGNVPQAVEMFKQAAAFAGFRVQGNVAAARACLAGGGYAQAMYYIDQAFEQNGLQDCLCAWAAWQLGDFQTPGAAVLSLDPLSIIELRSQIEDLRFGKPLGQ